MDECLIFIRANAIGSAGGICPVDQPVPQPKSVLSDMRSFIPFGDPWRMPISVPYSLLVKDEDLAWTCGQVPLDKTSQLMAPNDLLGQTEVVCDHIEYLLSLEGMRPQSLGKLVLYYVGRASDDAEQMIARCQSRFGDRPVFVPVAVPHFYFDGLLLEVDAFAGISGGKSIERSAAGAKVKVTDGGEVIWAALMVHPSQAVEGAALLESAIAEFGLTSDQRLSEHWVGPRLSGSSGELSNVAASLARLGLISDGGALVESAESDAFLVGEITYVKELPAPVAARSNETGGVKIIARRSGRFAWYSARSLDGNLGLASQTTRLMATLADTLRAEGMDFTAVTKSTSHYVAGNSADELYENMAIRNSYYRTPGPASTGLPVSRFADNNSKIVVDFVTVRTIRDGQDQGQAAQ